MQFHWPIVNIEREIQPYWPDFSAHAVSQVDSTNTRLLEAIRQGQTSPHLLVAHHQTQGRGQRGKIWHSQPGSCLTFSMSFPSPNHFMQGLALAIGCSVIAALDPLGSTLKIKWPNDIWYSVANSNSKHSWRKLAGILIETALYKHKRYAVIGVGVNMLTPALPDYAQPQAGSLKALGLNYDAPTVLSLIAPKLAQAMYNFDQKGLAPWMDLFKEKDILAGQMVSTSVENLHGTGAGIDAQGNYRLKTANGTIETLHSGEVRLRPC